MNLQTKTLSEVVDLFEEAIGLLLWHHMRWDKYDQEDAPEIGNDTREFLVRVEAIGKDDLRSPEDL